MENKKLKMNSNRALEIEKALGITIWQLPNK